MMDEHRMRTLRALCDTFVAPVEPPAPESDDPTGFWARSASDVAAHEHVAQYVLEQLPDRDREGMLKLLDLLGLMRFSRLPQAARESIVRGLSRMSSDIEAGLAGYRGLAIANAYGRAVDGGRNPNWEQFNYPGPPTTVETPQVEGPATFTPPSGRDEVELTCDVVVVGSGSGGGVVAGTLAESDRDVVVLEAGGAYEDDAFPPDELTALAELYWRGGPTATSDGNVSIMAGWTLGGGSTINWQNCVRPPDTVRETWALEHGLEGLDGDEFDAHLEAVLERIGATGQHSEMNGPNARLRDGAEALGWSWHSAQRNVDPTRYDPATAGHVGFGDRTGAKQGTLKTYLADAAEAGARIVVRSTARRILVRDGRAVGVEAVMERPDGGTRRVTVHAPQVVVAAGALETPALLLRSGIGGPAVGRYLRVHPVPNLPGFYPDPQEGWWGPPQTCIVDEHTDVVDGHGFLIETPHLHVGVGASAVPWRSAREHKLVVGRSSHVATFLAVCRERGSGHVTIDEHGEAVVNYPLEDPLDQEVVRRAVAEMAKLHAAAGAQTIVDIHPNRDVWKAGDDIDAFAERIAGLGLGRGGRVLFSAHQMGSARMGTDPATSVADPRGQLHDTSGVWIGDTSAFPTAVGSNPMITCMALARRTAHHLLDSAAAPG